ncbi:MAG: hypothetical protein WAW85_07765, partial [Gordonia sp. (in: high G+C Gram-positive bacteria)]|uniref:sacsin N-terminal ATP-binding-like domain-containing protein n=1 Tax=Gordonia sp. (in: high G+C Gram-positive bacteria) TaxID=84139 RepID=UPI003BB61676
MSPSALTDSSAADPFGTDSLRAVTLAGWRDSPTRLAEDVAAEADLAQIGYRDRWFTELAANAADAAVGTAEPGMIDVRADGPLLRVGNSGTPLSIDGVRALTALRVSPKSEAAVGRFGVGFRATSFVDRVDVLSVSGSITFDRERTSAELPGAVVPAQRLAWPLAERPAGGFATEVVLHCATPEQAADLLVQARAEAPDLLLELPALGTIVVGGETIARVDGGDHVEIADGDGRVIARWLQSSAGGNRWLVQVEGAVLRPLRHDYLRSPTPTQIPLTLPARLITDLPLTPDRRGLHPDADPATAAAGYTDLVLLAPAEQRYLLVPAPALGGGREDVILRAAVLTELAAARWVPAAVTSAAGDLTPDRTWILPGLTEPLAALLGELIEPLAAPSVSDGAPARALRQLGARELSLAEVADLLSGVEREPHWWARLYAALDPLVQRPSDADELGALPVPRTDGRLHRGVRGLALVDLPPGMEPRLDWIRGVAAAAYHPLLERLGLVRLSVTEVLSDPALAQLLTHGDDDEHEELADAILTLLGGRDVDPVVPSWVGTLRVPVDGAGEPREIDELLLPGSPVREVLYDDEPLQIVAPAVVAAYGEHALRRAGAGWGFTLLRADLPTGPDHHLDAEEQWWDDLEVPPETLVAVRDLELVDPACWPRALELLAGDRLIVEALTDAGGYTSWWLRRHVVVHGRRLAEYRHPDDETWRGLFDPFDHPAADTLRPLLAGAMPDDAAQAQDWLAALADSARPVEPGVAARAHAALLA